MHAVITAGGRVSGEFATLAGTDIKALAKIRGRTMLDRSLDALRAADIAQIAVVGGEAVRIASGDRIDRFIPEGATGAENVVLALRAWNDNAPLLYVTSDLPYVAAAALRDFIDRVPQDAVVVPLCPYDVYAARFPIAPPAGITLAGECVVNGGVFYLPGGSARQITDCAARFFDARKSPWRMAGLVGATVLLRFALRRLSIAALEREVSRIIEYPALALRNCAPELAFDADTCADYRYAHDHA